MITPVSSGHFGLWPNADVGTHISIRPLSGVKRTRAADML